MFKSVTPIYTGGGIYLFYGSLTDGTYFMADVCSAWTSARILDADPLKSEEESAYVEWQEEHLIRDLDDDDADDFIVKAIKWVKKHHPEDGNYSLSDMDYILSDIL